MKSLSLVMLASASAALAVVPAAAQNGYSFLDAAKSAVNYSAATVEPAATCESLRRLAETGLTITATTMVPASESAPAHCQVRGVIAPEIQFEVLLPAASVVAVILMIASVVPLVFVLVPRRRARRGSRR